MNQNRETGPPDEVIESSSISPVTQIVLVAGMTLVFLLISKLYFDQYLELKKLQAKLGVERTKNADYRHQIGSLQSECRLARTTQGVDILARERLKFIRSDEILVVPVK